MPSMIRVVLGRNVCKLRTLRNLAQEQLADLLGIHRTYVSRIEAGRARLSHDMVIGLQRALEVPDGALDEGQPKTLSEWRRMNGRKNRE